MRLIDVENVLVECDCGSMDFALRINPPQPFYLLKYFPDDGGPPAPSAPFKVWQQVGVRCLRCGDWGSYSIDPKREHFVRRRNDLVVRTK